jgi:oligoendopeptidase F
MSEITSNTSNALPTRSEVPVELTWDLSTIFASLADWESAFARATTYPARLSSYKGRVRRSGRILLEYLQLSEEAFELLGKLFYFASMSSDVDTAVSATKSLKDRVMKLWGDTAEACSFYTPEMLALKPERLAKFIASNPGLKPYQHKFDEINRSRPHVRTAEVQALLATTIMVNQGPSEIYGALTNADLVLPMIKGDDGVEVRLTEDNYGPFLDSKNREVRRAAFEALFSTYRGLRTSVSAMYAAQVNVDIFGARSSKYESSLGRALHDINVPASVYDSLVETVHANLPLLHRYLELRKRILGVDELHMYDLYVPLLGDVDDKISYADAKETVLAALAPLGEEYVNALRNGFNSRWVDVMPNKGKQSGAYSGGGYGTNPFILLNWQANIDSMFTLAHEAGHSMHSFFSRLNQPFTYSDYTMFVAEVASTTNEALLAHYLLSKTTDPKMRLYIINSQLEGIRTTLIRQTLFAEFEREAHARAEAGEPLTADLLCSIHKTLNEKYYGAAVKVDDLIDIEWARIPHFYNSFYVYQYATGISTATALASQILNEGAPAVERYLNFLKSGSSDFSINLLRNAGVDLSTPAPIQAAFDAFAEYLAMFEKEHAQLK